MIEYELNGKIYTEQDLINAAGGKDKLSAYIKSKGFKVASKKAKPTTKFYEKPGKDLYKEVFGFENPAKDNFSEINKTKEPKKKTRQDLSSSSLGFDKDGTYSLGDVPFAKNNKKTKQEGTKLDKRGYRVPKSYVEPDEPSMFDKMIDGITDIFKSEPENNGRLTPYDPGPIEQQRKKYVQDQKDALNGEGAYSFLKSVPKDERIIYAEKIAAPTYTKLEWDQQKGVHRVVPSQEAIDYVSKDIDLNKYKNSLELNQEIGKKVNELALNDPRLKFQQDLAKKNAAPLIKQKLNEIKKTYKLNTEADVAKAEKDFQNYALKTINDFLSKQPGFQELNDEFETIEMSLSNSLTKQWGRQQSGTLRFFDAWKGSGIEMQKSPNALKNAVGWVAENTGTLAEFGTKAVNQLANSFNETRVSASHGDVIELQKFYNKYKDRKDDEKFTVPETFTSLVAGIEGMGQYEAASGLNAPKTFGEARDRIDAAINKLYGNINKQVEDIGKTKEFIGLFDEVDLADGVDAKDIFGLIGEQTPNLAITTAGAVTRNPLITGLGVASMFTQTYGDMYYSAIEEGLKNDLGRKPTSKEIADAIAKGKYANRAEALAWAAVSSGAEYFGDLNIIKNTGRALGLGETGQDVMGSLLRGEIKNVGKSLVNKGIATGKSAFGEYLTEGFQTGLEQASLGSQIAGDVTKYINPTEMNNSAQAGGLIGFIFPFAGTVASQTTTELRASAVKVASGFNISTNAVQVDNFFKEAAKNIENKFTAGELTDKQKATELETLATIRSSSNKVPSNFSGEAKKKAIDLILEKSNLEKQINGKDKDLIAPEIEQLKKVSTDLALLAFGEKQRVSTEKNLGKLETSIENIGSIIDKEGKKVFKGALGRGKAVEVFETKEDAQNAYNEWFKNDIDSTKNDLQISLNNGDIDQNTYNKEIEKLDNSGPQDISNADGFVLSNGQILINKERAAEVGALNVAPHELLHNILKSEFSDSNRKIALKDQFLSILSKSERRKLDERILAKDENGERLYSDEDLQNAPDEYITQYFELIADGSIKWNDNIKETLINLWDNILKPLFVKKGFKNIEFEDGRDIYNFVKTYAKTIKKGKISDRASGLLKAGEDISGVTKFSKTQSELVKEKIADLEENEGDYDPNEYDQELARLEGELKRAIAKENAEVKPAIKKETTEEDVDKEIIKNEKGTISSDKVQRIYDEKGINGAQEIIDLFKPITKKLVNRRMDAPGFDRELLTSEIETGDGGLLYLIRSYKPEKGVPLAAYINKQLPLRAIAASRRVLDKDFSKDVTEEKGLIAEETVSEVKEKPKYKNALESNVFSPDVLKTATNKIITVVRTLKNRIDAPVTLNRTVTPLISEIRDEVGKQLDIDIKTMLGGKKDGVLRKELLRTKRYILENMTTTWLMGKDGQGGIPQAIQKQIDGKWVSFPDWVGQKIDREKTTTDQAGRTSGAELVRRLPNVNNNVSDEDFLAQIIGPDGNPIRGRKESLSKAMAEEGAFDIINADFAEEGPIFQAFATNQERLGYEVAANTVNEFVRQSDRGNIKKSKTYNNFNEKQKELFNSKINELSFALNPYLTNPDNKSALLRIFKNILINDFSIDEIKALVADFRPWLRQMRDVYQPNVSKLKDENFDFNNFIKNIAIMHEEGVLDVLNMDFSHESLFDVDNVTDARTTTVNMFSDWVDKFGKEQAIKMMIYSGGTFKSNSALGNLMGIRINPETKKVELSGETGRKSNQITESADDYWDNIVYNSLPGDPEANKLLVDKIKKETSSERKRDSASESYKDKDFEGRKKRSLEYRKIVQETFSYYFNPKNEVSDAAKAIMIVQMGSNMETAIRKSAILTHLYVPKKGVNAGALRYEHTRPASQVIADILKAYKKGNGIVDQKILDDIWSTYNAAVIPVIMDDNFNKAGFKSKMPPGWKKGMPTYYRYYNYATFGRPDMFAIQSIDPKDKGAIIGEKFVKASDAMVNGVVNGKKIDAVTKSLTASKTPKGISVFDFDDTVGLTKSNVLYTKSDETVIFHGGSIKGLKDIKGPLYVATDKKQAEEYSKGNEGAVKSFVIKTNEIVNEDVVIDEINALGLKSKDSNYEVGELNLYELIDPNFETSLSDKDLNTLFNSLKKKGIKAVEFLDMNLESLKNDIYNIVILDKGIVQEQSKLTGEEFAKEGTKLLEEGVTFDFSEFSKVVDGKPGPMVEKMKKMIAKFGPENFFILTARPQEAAGPIYEFLDSIGINIPLENITGLGNSAAQAKADWIVGKAADGYNDFYFADDAPQNVKAVQDALDVLDVKSKIQQAKLKFSKSMSVKFNEIIETNTGIESYKVYSDITARRRGVKKNRFDFYVPPSAADFELLLYKFMGKGAVGEEQKQFFEDALIKPYINGVNLMDAVRQSIKREYKALLKSFPGVKKELESLTPNKDFTYDQAMRVAIWSQFGVEIPGLSQRDTIYLTDLVNNDPDLAAFKDGLIAMGRQKNGWLPPSDYWDADTIVSDLYNITEGAGRKKFLGEFIENVEEIFGTWQEGKLVGPNMNKVEAAYGTNVREALEDSIYRMTNGKNRSYGGDKETAAWSSWVNGSTGAIMFLNTRSAALQMLGAVNFLNWRDNNPYTAGKAFLNQPQYWKDFARIWNSDKLKERRGGLREDVASAEIANAAAGSKNKVVAVTSYLLKIGYTPTQLADSFAIASGGAPFYRNRINSYLKEGLTEQEAEKKAWEDFSKISDETQQSGDPKDISKQQSSGAGRLLLVFQNFTMQQSRIVKKAVLDLKNGRGDAKTNIAKIAYYLAVQNIMFSTLQQGLFAVMFDDDDEEEKAKKGKKTKQEAAVDIANGVLDSILRGTGFLGGIIATTKNVLVKYFEEAAKKQKAEYAKVVLEVANMSPPIGSKLRKTYSALQQTKYDKDLIEARGWGVMQDGRVHLGPMYSVSGKAVEVTTNFPMDRLVNKVENISQAFNSENTAVQRMATGLGYSPWTVGIEGTKGDILIKETAKAKRKVEGIEKGKITRKENAQRLKDSIKSLPIDERIKYKRKKALEKREERIKKSLEKRKERQKKMDMINKLNANK